MKKIKLISILVAISVSLFMATDVYAQTAAQDREAARKERERQALIKKMEQLKAEREKANATATSAPTSNLEQTLAQYEAYYTKNCDGDAGKTSRCADALFSMAAGFYKDARDGFVRAQNEFDLAMSKWEKTGIGNRPTHPRPDYSKALRTFEDAVARYPDFVKAAEGWLNIGNILLLDGDTKGAKTAFETLTQKYPKSRLASAAHFRVAEICFSDIRDFSCALDNLLKIRNEDVTPDVIEMAHFRKAEIYYIRGDLDMAAELFGSYVDKSDRREFPKRELRGEALQYLAVAFSDMPEGANAAIAYFKKLGARTYEDTVIYAVGMKNYDHGQYDQAIVALKTALEKFPLFVDAPKAQMNIINSLVIRQRNEEANKEREVLVANFSDGSAWARANTANPIARAVADENIKLALSSIAIHNHALAQERTDSTEKANYYAKAIDYYERVITGYPEDKWAVFEYRYNVAEAYMSTGHFEKAATSYDFVASADLKTYPVYRAEIDTLGSEADAIEKAKAANTSKTSPVNISQSDAGFNAIAALDTLRKVEIAKGNLTPEQAYALPITARFIDYIKSYQQKFPDSENASEVLFLAASVHFDGGNFKEAVAVSLSLISAYGKADTAMFRRATKLAADSYVKDNQFELGIAFYDTLISRTPNTSENYQIYVDLGAAAIFQKASDYRTNKQVTQAVNEFKRIATKYPTSQVADDGWFEAAVTFEEADSAVSAANVFVELATIFPKSDLVERSFVRAAENFAKVNDYTNAGATMKKAAEFVNKPEFSIGAFSKASDYFKLAKDYTAAGDMYYEVYRRYPTDGSVPLALYNSGLLYEEGQNFVKAIEVYTILGTKYADSEYAPSGYFSIGLVYERMGDMQRMATAFVDYAKKFTSNRDSQVKALVKAGIAFKELGNDAEAENNLRLATQVFTKFRESDALSTEDGAKAFFNLAEILRVRFESIKLTGKTQREIDAAAKRKSEAFQPVIENYMQAASMAIAEWTIRSIYSIGLTAKNYAADVREQTLIGKDDVRLGTQIKILSETLHPIYEEAISNLAKAVSLARESGIKADYVKEAELLLMQTWFLKAYAFEEAGSILRNSPIPDGLDEEEEMAYIDALEEYYANYVQAAFPVYEMGIQNAMGLFIGKNVWTDTIQTHMSILSIEFGVESQLASMDLNAEQAKARVEGRFVEVSAASAAIKQAESDYQQALSAIGSIVASNVSIDDKLSSLASRRANAERSKLEEEAKIEELKNKLGLE